MASKGHVGKAGHLAVMAEFLLRGYNVAMPEVDVGDDIFVVHDREGTLWRIQVKTAVGKQSGNGFRGKFAVTVEQLNREKGPDLVFVFALRRGVPWEFLVIPRAILQEETSVHHTGSESGGTILYTVRSASGGVFCSGRDWSVYRGNWAAWPLIED
jgi:hypothetical protein